MLVGSRLVGCVRPRVSGMHYTFRLPELKKEIPHLTALHSPCGPSHSFVGFMLQADQGIAPLPDSSLASHLASQQQEWHDRKTFLAKNKWRWMGRPVECCFVSPSKR